MAKKKRTQQDPVLSIYNETAKLYPKTADIMLQPDIESQIGLHEPVIYQEAALQAALNLPMDQLPVWKRRQILESDWFEAQVQSYATLSTGILHWGHYRQIYQFDAQLAQELAGQMDLNLPTAVFEQLPFPAFYVDCAGSLLEGKISGFFVSLLPKTEEQAASLSLTYLLSFADQDSDAPPAVLPYLIVLDEKSTVSSDLKQHFSYMTRTSQKLRPEVAQRLCGVSEKEFKALSTSRQNNPDHFIERSLQLVLYLMSSRPELDQMQKTRKPQADRKRTQKSSPVSFKDAGRWSVGVRFGSRIRQQKMTQTTKAESVNAGSNTGSRKRSHLRRGHWRYQPYGPRNDPDRQTHKLIWIHPMMVGSLEEESPVVIHTT